MEHESNISYDHVALEAMKQIMHETMHEMVTPLNRLKRWLGLPYRSWLGGLPPEQLARQAHCLADAMMAERAKRAKPTRG